MCRDAVCCSVLRCVAVCCSVLQFKWHVERCSVVQCVAVCCGVLQCVAVQVACGEMQCSAVCCGVLQSLWHQTWLWTSHRHTTLSDSTFDNWAPPSIPQNRVHCNTLQHTATHCNTLQHTAPHCTPACSTKWCALKTFPHFDFRLRKSKWGKENLKTFPHFDLIWRLFPILI